MRVLAIDTALGACSCGVLDTDHGGMIATESLPMVRGHAEALMPLVARVIAAAHLSLVEIDRVAVTVGPGSFTGLRVAVAAGRGIALASAKPAVGVTTLAVYAAPYLTDDDSTPLMAAIDARNNNVFAQMFGPGGRSVMAPRLISIAEAVRAAASGSARLVGSAADRIAAAWPAHQPLPPVVDTQSAPSIEWVARLGAATAADATTIPKPLYLRAPDAQPQDAARLPRR